MLPQPVVPSRAMTPAAALNSFAIRFIASFSLESARSPSGNLLERRGVEFVPVIEVIQIDGAAIRAALVVVAASVKDSFARAVVVVVAANVAIDLVDACFDKINSDIRGYNHDDGTRKGIFDACGHNDQSCSYRGAIDLNNLDDWNEFHAAALK